MQKLKHNSIISKALNRINRSLTCIFRYPTPYLSFIILITLFGNQPLFAQDPSIIVPDKYQKITYGDIIQRNLSILDKDPLNIDASLTLAETFYMAGDFRMAVQYCNISLDLLEDYLSYTKDTTENNQVLLRKPYDLSSIYQLRGKSRHRLGDYTKSNEDYLKALELDGENTELYIDLGNLSYNQQLYDQALLYFKMGANNNPSDFKAFFNQGHIFYVWENTDSAIWYYQKSITLNPDYAYTYFYLGTVYNMLHEYNLAIAAYDKAIEIEPDQSEFLKRRAQSLTKSGDYDKALIDWYHIGDIDSLSLDVIHNISLVKVKKGDYKGALSELESILEENPHEYATGKMRGQLYLEMNKYKKARKDFTKLLDIKPDDSEVMYLSGLSYYYQKKKLEACYWFNKAENAGYSSFNKKLNYNNYCR